MAHPDYRPRRKRKKSWLHRILLWSAGIAVVLAVAVVIATPWILRAAVPEVFARIGIQASATGGSLSLLRREVTLTGLTVGAPDAPALSLGELGVGLALGALVEGRVKLRHLRVQNVSIDAERLMALEKLENAQPGSTQGPLPVELDEIVLEDVRLVSLAERIGHDVRVQRLTIGDLSALLADKKSKVDLQGAIGDGSVSLQLEVGLEKGNVRATGKYHADKLPVRGWAGLASEAIDPVSAGSINGRGDIQIDYGLEAKALDLSLDGRLSTTGLGMSFDPLRAEGGDATWQGLLGLRWAPDLATPKLRGNGNLEVESLHLVIAEPSRASLQAAIGDLSWHGDFDWQGGLTTDGAVAGASVEARGALGDKSGWRTRAEDFSWRLHARIDAGSNAFEGRVQDFDLSRLSVSVTDADAPVEVTLEKLAVDEMRAAQSGDLVLGSATVDTLRVTNAGGADALKLSAERLTANGLSGDFSGKLQAAKVTAESLDVSESGRRLRAESIDFASVGYRAPAWIGFDELKVESMRADQGRGDIWLSGLEASKVHGEASGPFGVEKVDITHMFQARSGAFSWDASNLKVRGIRGDSFDAAEVATIDLGAVKIGIDETTWESSDLHSSGWAANTKGHLKVASLGLATLERRQPSTGDLSITKLDARGFDLRDEHAVLDAVTAAVLEYKLHGGDAFQAHTLEARGLGGDASDGLQVRHFSAAAGSGHLIGGARLSAGALESRGLALAANGGVAIEQAELGRFTRTGADSATLDLERLSIASTRRAPGGQVSIAKAALHAARVAVGKGVSWRLSRLDTGMLAWDGANGIRVQQAAVASASQLDGQSRDWQAQGMRATDFRLSLPEDIEVAALSVASIDGGAGAPDWKAVSIKATGLDSSEAHGQKVGLLTSGTVTVSDTRNGARLEFERAEIKAAGIDSLKELSAGSVVVGGLRVHSEKPDWPARLRVAELRVTAPRLGADGALDLGSVVARHPYLIVAQAKDNTWMWPPLPGVGDGGKRAGKADHRAAANGAIRMASFITRGPGRIAYIDRATEPAVHVILDPVVIAVHDLDTRLHGHISQFRARGTGSKFAGLNLRGQLKKRVGGFDLGLHLFMAGTNLPIFNPYVTRREPFAIAAGRGDARAALTVENDALTGKVDVLLSGLEMKSTAGGKFLQEIDPANFPIRTALALLKDQNGNISLVVPLKARTDNPSYDFVDQYQKDFIRVVTRAGKVAADLPGKTLERALQLFEGTISLLPGIDAERYTPVEFAPGSDDLTAVPLVYLDQLGKRMREHESLVLAFCGRSVSTEDSAASGPPSPVDTLFAEASKGVYHAFAPGQKGLLALAETRAARVRSYLHEIHHIPEARLLACDARIDAGDGEKPRVDLQVKTPAGSKGLFGSFL